jgi:nicotinamidase-related amidase
MIRFDIDPGPTALLIVDMQNCFVADSPIAAPRGGGRPAQPAR